MEEENYNITIITVSYNCNDELKQVIDSTVPFLSDKVEYLIIDGQSNDGTIKLLQSYEKVEHLRFISEPDSGIYNAMNKGASLALGEWICYINCGDYLEKIPNLNRFDEEVAVAFAVRTESGIEHPRYNKSLRLRNTIPHQGLFYRKKYFKGFDEQYKVFADYALNLDMLNCNEKIATVDDIVAFHSLKGISNNIRFKDELERILKEKNSIIFYYLSLVWFKIRGLKTRILK